MEAATIDAARAWLRTPKRNLAGGAWLEGGRLVESVNPASGAPLGAVCEADGAVVDRAVAAARSAFEDPRWARMPRRERAALLRRIGEVARRHRAELATLISLENGKLYREAYDDDMPDTADVFDYYAGWTDKYYGETCPVDGDFLNYTLRLPVGVCGLIVPWNFPLLLAAWKIAPALALGNAVVVKPAPPTPYSLTRFLELVQAEVDPPAGLINLVHGGAAVGEALTRHAGVDKISFTGSTATGRRILHGAADSNLKRVTLELGGKSPNLVFDDVADFDAALERSFQLAFSQKGEKCSEPTRFLLQRGIYEAFAAGLVERAERVRCGDPFDPSSEQGPQCTREQRDKILSYIDLGRREGARLLAGGGPDTGGDNARGFFVRPTVFGPVDNRSRLAQEEIFGPVLALVPFDSEEEAVALANDTVYGLAAGLWTRDVARAHRVAARLDAGMVFVNRYGCYDFASPFGGLRQSGWGKEMGVHSLDAYSKLKSVWIAH